LDIANTKTIIRQSFSTKDSFCIFAKSMHGQPFEIKTAEFEGPFDLLLFFIEREELNIHEVSLSKITDDFLAYIQKMQELNMEVASEFILVAATLMRIKVRTLIPKPVIDEEGNEVDLQEDLIQKLVIYKKFKMVCEDFKQLEDNRWKLVERGNISFDLHLSTKQNDQVEELASLDLFKLMKAYEKVMSIYGIQKDEVRHTVVKYPYTIEQQKISIATLLEINKKLNFQSILKNSENKVQFVYNFLAILEMLQQQILELQLGLGYNNFSITSKND
jgi:segregation and condensation protein A